jgi:hypothetical protein
MSPKNESSEEIPRGAKILKVLVSERNRLTNDQRTYLEMAGKVQMMLLKR